MTHVKTAVIVLITAMLLSLVLTYASIMTIIQTSKSNTERIMHSFITENSTYIFSSIKNGNDFIPAINAGYFTEKYISDGTFDFDETYLYNKNSEGGYVYKLSVPQVSFTVNKGAKGIVNTADEIVQSERKVSAVTAEKECS